MFLCDEFNGDYLSGLGREESRRDPQRVWPLTICHLHNINFVCRTSHLLPKTVLVLKWILFTCIKERLPSEVLENRMK